MKCFTADGYDAASIERICELSGSSVGSFYHYFGSKEGVAAELFEHGIVAYQSGLLEILRAGDDPARTVAGIARHHLIWAKQNPEWARYLLQMGSAPATAGARPSVRTHNEELLSAVGDWAAPHRSDGHLVDVDPVTLLSLILGPSHALSRAWLSGTWTLDDTTIELVSEAAVRAVQEKKE